jgi:hypothetical protein
MITCMNFTRPVTTTLGLMLIITALVYAGDPARASAMIKDNGMIQIATASLLCLCVLVALRQVLFGVPPVLQWAEAAGIMLVYAMREMDFHRLFTAEHVTRLKFYTGPFPVQEKLLGGAAMLAAIALLAHFTIKNMPGFWKKLKAGEPVTKNILVWAVLLLGSQLLDKPRFARGLLVKISEETMELSAAFLMLLILLSFPLKRNKPGS